MAETPPFSFADGFPRATQDGWRRLVDAALKGQSFQRLESKTYDGLTVKPLYEGATTAAPVPGRLPGKPWSVMQRLDHPDPAAANAQGREDLANGATALALVLPGSVSANGFGLAASPAALARALDGIAPDTMLDLDLTPFAREDPQHVADAVRQKTNPAAASIRFGYDPITAAAISGKMPLPWSKTAPAMAGLIHNLGAAGFRGPFAVGDGRIIHNAGGSEAQELAYALASALTYLRALEASGMSLEAARDAIYFRLSADADQFLTMAKFRAVRKLWARVEQACGLTSKPATVAAETAWRMMTRRDPCVNILRTTIAVAAAGFGGADAITVLPHTAPLGLPDALARRIARNLQLVLLEESNLARVTDPAAGSGAIEALTQELCTAAWSAFQEIEAAGGAWAALEQGLIQRKVAAVRTQRQEAVAHGKDMLTGTNGYPELTEITPAVLDVRPAAAPEIKATVVIEALPRLRLAAPFEDLRDRSDTILAKTGARPEVFLATLGSPAEFTARMTFARNFFEAGGIEALGSPGPDLAAVYKTAGTALVCLCSSDGVYEKEAVGAAQTLKTAGAKHIYLAGKPGEGEAALRGAGVQSFIYEGCDMLATLTAAYAILG